MYWYLELQFQDGVLSENVVKVNVFACLLAFGMQNGEKQPPRQNDLVSFGVKQGI